jgi:TorA maturation chaperone TorD
MGDTGAKNAIQLLNETRARSRVYHLFSDLYGRGLTGDVLPIVQAIQDLAPLVPDPFDADEAAADHYALFSLDVFPYASVFLDGEGRLGGSTTDAVQRHYAEAGFQPALDRESADHLGHELALLAFLSDAETEALEDDKAHKAERMRRRMQAFMDEHLLWWLPAFVQAVQQQSYPFYAALGRLTLEVVLDHRAALGKCNSLPEKAVLEEPPDVLEEEKTGLKDIAAYLATPAWSGLFLSRSDLARLGRGERLPRGFGSRVQTLTNLLRAAVEFDRRDALLHALSEQVGIWERWYRVLSGSGLEGLGVVSQTWLDRLDTTRSLIERMRKATHQGLAE